MIVFQCGSLCYREYLGKLELEKRQQENIIAELETDLHNVKSERNEFMNK